MKTFSSIKKSCWTIMKLIFPIYIAVDVAHYFGLLKLVSTFFAPISKILGLPPEAALALAGGGIFNLYTGIALASPLGLNYQQWTTIAVFLGLFHSIVIEAAVLKKLKIPVWATVTIRFSMAFLCSYLVSKLNLQSAAIEAKAVSLTQYQNFSEMITHSFLNASKITLKVMVMIAGIIWLFDMIKKSAFFGKKVSEHSWFFNVLVGLLLGVTYGAGLLLNEEAGKTRSSLPTAFFLLLCHGIIEETLLFTMFGANGLPVVLSRLVTALAAAFVCVIVLKYRSNKMISFKEELV